MANRGLSNYRINISDLNSQQITLNAIRLYEAGTRHLATVYSDAQGGTLSSANYTNSYTNGCFSFYGTGAYDIVLTDNQGRTYYKYNVEGSEAVTLDTQPAVCHLSYSIGIGSGSNCDYYFDDAQENDNNQILTLSSIIPAYAKVIDCFIRCEETLDNTSVANPSIDTTLFEMSLGTALATPNDKIARGSCDAEDDIIVWTPNATAWNVLNEISTVYVDGRPNRNLTYNNPSVNDYWSAMTAGEWVVSITYIPNGQYVT